MFLLGVKLIGGTINGGNSDGTSGSGTSGNRTDDGQIQASDVLDDYSYILFDGSEESGQILFRCVTGLGPNGSDCNDAIGNLYHNNVALPDGECSGGFLQAEGDPDVRRYPGVYNARSCSSRLTTSAEGVYMCTLTNSSMMNQSVRIGLYFSERSKSYCHNR